jgi:hypothetical protein
LTSKDPYGALGAGDRLLSEEFEFDATFEDVKSDKLFVLGLIYVELVVAEICEVKKVISFEFLC